MGLNVLSLFDGMSCGQIALKELGIPVDSYFASEVDKFAIQQTDYNFPNTVQLGSVVGVNAKELPKIDLLIGGSPCQGFSFAGKQLNFNDPRSSLFFEYARIWNEVKAINPEAIFLLENVNMKVEFLRVISEYMKVFPVNLNSNLVSAQNRDRWFWTNIKTKEVGLFNELYSDIPLPKDRGIFLKHILQPEDEIAEKYYLNKKLSDFTITDNYLQLNEGFDPDNRFFYEDGKHGSVLTKGAVKTGVCVAMRGRNPENSNDRRTGSPTEQRLEPKTDGKTNCLTSVAKDNLITDGINLRRLTPTECARLQTIPDWYKWIVNESQIYRMLGNGWTVEVIKHIFTFIDQLELTETVERSNPLSRVG